MESVRFFVRPGTAYAVRRYTLNSANNRRSIKRLTQTPLCMRYEPEHMSPEQLATAEGYSDVIEYLESENMIFDSVVPACCEYECRVEPDGICPHGHKSILLEMGLI